MSLEAKVMPAVAAVVSFIKEQATTDLANFSSVKDKRFHLGIPKSRLMAEVNPCSHHVSHRHTHNILRVKIISPTPELKTQIAAPAGPLKTGYFFFTQTLF